MSVRKKTWEVGNLRKSSNVTLECYNLRLPVTRQVLSCFKTELESCTKYLNASLEVRNFIKYSQYRAVRYFHVRNLLCLFVFPLQALGRPIVCKVTALTF